jgi:5-methylthioribose kinase
MAGEVDPKIAEQLGTLLGTLHLKARCHRILVRELSDTTLFEELRVDPYYRTVARSHPDIAPRIASLIDSMESRPLAERTLVLGDYSPKNILVHSQGLVLLDFECAHQGDPAFDLGFFLSHLVLKAIHLGRDDSSRFEAYLSLADRFWSSYHSVIGTTAPFGDRLLSRAIAHTATCILARVDGKSPVEYLDPLGKQTARKLGRELLGSAPETWEHAVLVIRNR